MLEGGVRDFYDTELHHPLEADTIKCTDRIKIYKLCIITYQHKDLVPLVHWLWNNRWHNQ